MARAVVTLTASLLVSSSKSLSCLSCLVVLLPGIPTLCRATPRTLQASCPNPASCGRSNVLGPHCICVTFRSPVMNLVAVMSRHPTETASAAPLHLERFVARTVERPAAQAEKRFDRLPSVLTRWLQRPRQHRRISDAPASSSAVCLASAFRLTALSLPLLCQARTGTIRWPSWAPFPHSRQGVAFAHSSPAAPHAAPAEWAQSAASTCSAATRGFGDPLLQRLSRLKLPTSRHSKPCSATMQMTYLRAHDLSQLECVGKWVMQVVKSTRSTV